MPTDIRKITSSNLEDLVRVINGSSSGHVFQYDTDVYGFLALARFWNLSYSHSLLSYVDNQPAGILLNAVHPEDREAFTLYWGVLPEFRRGRVAMSLVDAYFTLLHRQGYLRTDADETHGSPSPIYKKLGYRPNQVFADIETDELEPNPGGNSSIEIRQLDCEQLISLHPDFPGFRYWAQRAHFLRHSDRFMDFLGAFRNDRSEGYLVRTFSPGHLVILDFRFKSREAAWALLQKACDSPAPPFTASFVPVPGPTYDFLIEAGFSGVKRCTSMTLELSASSSQFVRRTFR